MDRQVVFVDQNPLDTDQLYQSKNTMIALGMLIQALLGQSTLVDGLACNATAPASLQVIVSPGSIYALENVDNTAYGSVPADEAHQIMKQGISLDPVTLNCPAPGTAGYSVAYLVQAIYQDTDAGTEVLPYYNSDNPDVAYNGPNGTGVSQNTVRKGQLIISAKAGVAATTGTQVPPAPDAGYSGLYVITVQNTQTQITSTSISRVAGAPFIAEKLNDKISIPTGDARYQRLGTSAITVLNAPTTFYLAPAGSGGSDSNTGLTSGSPWLTRQHAWDTVKISYDLNAQPINFKFANGTYTDVFAPNGWLRGQFYPGQVTFSGNSGTPSGVIFNPTSGDSFIASYCAFMVEYMLIENAANSGLNAAAYGNIIVGPGLTFGACANAQILASSPSSLINLNNSYAITGGGQAHWTTQAAGASIIVGPSIGIAITGTPNFSATFAQASLGGQIFWQAPVPNFTGTFTGSKYSVNTNAILAAQGSSSTIPGSSAGSYGTGGEIA